MFSGVPELVVTHIRYVKDSVMRRFSHATIRSTQPVNTFSRKEKKTAPVNAIQGAGYFGVI